MEARETWDCVEKSLQVTVTEDSAPNDNNWIGFGFISPPPSPQQYCGQKTIHFDPLCSKFNFI